MTSAGPATTGPDTATPHAVEVVRRYVIELYNHGNVGLVDEICADPMARHSSDGVINLSRAEQTDRITKDLAANSPQFTIVSLFGDDTHACLTWNAERRTNGETLCGIEIFEVHDGVITDVWNSNYFKGTWK